MLFSLLHILNSGILSIIMLLCILSELKSAYDNEVVAYLPDDGRVEFHSEDINPQECC